LRKILPLVEMTIHPTFAAFASLREIFRFFWCGFAALGLRGE
jgi:hypothetical protein